MEPIETREQQVWNDSTLRFQSNQSESRHSDRSQEGDGLARDGSDAKVNKNQFKLMPRVGRNINTEESAKEPLNMAPSSYEQQHMHRTSGTFPFVKQIPNKDKSRNNFQRHHTEGRDVQLVDLHEKER